MTHLKMKVSQYLKIKALLYNNYGLREEIEDIIVNERLGLVIVWFKNEEDCKAIEELLKKL